MTDPRERVTMTKEGILFKMVGPDTAAFVAFYRENVPWDERWVARLLLSCNRVEIIKELDLTVVQDDLLNHYTLNLSTMSYLHGRGLDVRDQANRAIVDPWSDVPALLRVGADLGPLTLNRLEQVFGPVWPIRQLSPSQRARLPWHLVWLYARACSEIEEALRTVLPRQLAAYVGEAALPLA